MATSDSRLGVVTALSGFALIRFPTGRSRLRRTEPGLSGCADALSLRATALYTVPADRFHSRCIPVRSRLRLQGTGSPREKLQLSRRDRWWIWESGVRSQEPEGRRRMHSACG